MPSTAKPEHPITARPRPTAPPHGAANAPAVCVLALDARGRVAAADAAASALLAYGGPSLRHGVDLPAALRAAGEGTAALAIANALATPDAGEVTFTVHDAGGLARTRWRLLPLPAAPGAALAAAWTVVVESEPDGAPGRREAETLAAVARVALDADDAAAGAANILAELDRVVPTLGKLLSVVDRERGVLRCLAATGNAAYVRGSERPLASTVEHDALARGAVVEIADLRAALHDRDRAGEDAPAGGVVLVPIMRRGVLIGVLCVHHPVGVPLDTDAIATLRLLGPSVGVALEVLQRDERERARLDEERRHDEQLRQAEKLAALGELVAGVAHEMNNPLAGISAFAELLLDEPADAPFRAEDREAVRLIKREADRATAVVRDLLSFAREAAPAWGPVALDRLLERTVRVRDYAAPTAGVDLRLELEPDLPPVRGDERKLQQVFINLIANAEHASRASTAGERRVTVRAWLASPTRVGVRVSDTGPGVPAEVLGRVFEPFFTTKPPGEGTGLGLSVSYGIVQTHGGELRGQNLPGGGAAFDVLLPIDAGAGLPWSPR